MKRKAYVAISESQVMEKVVGLLADQPNKLWPVASTELQDLAELYGYDMALKPKKRDLCSFLAKRHSIDTLSELFTAPAGMVSKVLISMI